jgi:hypothetical protein
MMPKPITSEELMPILRGLLRAVAEALIQTTALQVSMKTTFAAFGDHLESAQAVVREDWKPFLDRLEGVSPDSLLSILQKFEGPLQ